MRILFLCLLSFGFVSSLEARIIKTAKESILYKLNEANVLEPTLRIPSGTKLKIKDGAAPDYYQYKDSSGKISRSTNGFYPGVQVLSVPRSKRGEINTRMIRRLNEDLNFMGSIDVILAIDSTGTIPPMPLTGEPDATYLKYFDKNGKRLNNRWGEKLRQRFGSDFNREVRFDQMKPEDAKKWRAIYRELVAVADRSHYTQRKPLFIDSGNIDSDIKLANEYSADFESTGNIKTFGAWHIAVMGTARRNGFGNVPCAEFQSEIIRQAYTRAGYRMADDFKGSNYLYWKNTAAVVNLTTALHQAGWIPWDPYFYKPKTGAIAMHTTARTPGHTYLIAGANGRIIIDNGSPGGRDLFKSNASRDLIDLMYDIGVFFLPPGIIPDKWD